MVRRNKLLLVLFLTGIVGLLYWGCSQPNDVLTPKSETSIWLNETNLPDNPPGMAYELWVANDNDTISLGKFAYSNKMRKYFDVDMVARADSNLFIFDKDIMAYDVIFVSVETNPDNDISSPGPIMLIDKTSDPTIKMVFPLIDTLWNGTVRYSMECTSDGVDKSNNGHSVWFANFVEKTVGWNDTTNATIAIDSSRQNVMTDTFFTIDNIDTIFVIDHIDTTSTDPLVTDTFYTNILDYIDTLYFIDSIVSDTSTPPNVDTFYAIDSVESLFVYDTSQVIIPDTLSGGHVLPRDSSFIVKDTSYVRGLDTFTRTVVRFDVETKIDSVPPYYTYSANIDYTVKDSSIVIDTFTQDDYGLPILTNFGWHYKGWVVSPYIDTTAVGKITLPGWSIIGDEFNNSGGGLLTTGTFSDIAKPDDANPYVVSSRVPPYPGEDFLQNLPAPLDSVNLVPNSSGGNPGHVFITLEPNNFVTDTTNFPLIAFLGNLPDNRSEVVDSLTQEFTLKGWMFSNDPYRGFPKIEVMIKRF